MEDFNLESEIIPVQKPRIYVEKTLCLIKPEAVCKEEEICDILKNAGFIIIARRKVQLSCEESSEFYMEHFTKMFFPKLIAYITCNPIVVYCIAKQDGVELFRQLLGPSNSLIAKDEFPDSLRAIYGIDEIRNGIHGSLNKEKAEQELKFFFPNMIMEPLIDKESVGEYMRDKIYPTLLKSITDVCRIRPADPVEMLINKLIEYNPNKPLLMNECDI